ncbi:MULTISPECIES: hypothetical protein [unclassified Zunongwangia]|uniref:hypothetical protein n=1 Tax=unclassified Zunongwangia TaxID=2632541 RepID=UPI0022DE8C96|nr:MULTISPECIES: hypothetical protein [unclassified Zunongwangia]WBL22283.1 hypothetical protein PBT89_16410 [Zunongwangia sp. HRR-M8]WBL25769.1 hypothetical protein PBT91_00405 [Zunongwangia sp. HGR-M22]
MKNRITIFFLFMNSMLFAQAEVDDCTTCPPNYVCYEGSCIPNSGGPPPPGLDAPIDKEIPFTLFAGLVFGAMYVYKTKSKRVQ